jgi:hypothetical protein
MSDLQMHTTRKLIWHTDLQNINLPYILSLFFVLGSLFLAPGSLFLALGS